MTELDLHRPTPHAQVETAFLQDEAVLFDRRTGRVHELNPSASAVWLLLDGELTVDDVASELHELIGVPLATLRADIPLVVDDLARRGLLAGTEPLASERGGHDQGREAPGELVVLPRPPDT